MGDLVVALAIPAAPTVPKNPKAVTTASLASVAVVVVAIAVAVAQRVGRSRCERVMRRDEIRVANHGPLVGGLATVDVVGVLVVALAPVGALVVVAAYNTTAAPRVRLPTPVWRPSPVFCA